MSITPTPFGARRRIAGLGVSALAVAAVAMSFALAAPAAQADTIVFSAVGKRPRSKVRVLRENAKEVVFQSGGKDSPEIKVPAREVRAVVYDDAPASYAVGEQERGSKRWGEAAKAYEKSLSAAGVRPWIKQYANYNLGECYRQLGATKSSAFDTAIEHYQAVLAAQTDCRFIAETKYGLAIAMRGKKDFSGAERVLKELEGDVTTHGLAKHWGVTARLESARLLESQGRFGEAEAKYRSLGGSVRANFPKVANLANMRAGLCMVAAKKFDDARRHFSDLLRSAGDEEWEVQAGGHLGLGLCFYAEEEYQQARYEFLKVNAVYGNTEPHAEATYWAGKSNIQRQEKDKTARLEAKMQFREVIALHPASTWADKAEKELLELGESSDAIARLRR